MNRSHRRPENRTVSSWLGGLLVLALLASCEQRADLAIANVSLIDAANGVRSGQTVLLKGDEIVAIQAAGDPVSAAKIIDAEGKFLIPGLWDFHVHLTYDPRLTDAMPGLFLSWGITSVRDTGGLIEQILPVVDSMRAGDAVAPRVFFAGPLLDGTDVVYDGDGRPEIGTRVSTPEEGRALVRELQRRGVDFVKVYEMLTPEVFAAIVETAHELGLPVDSHVPLSMRARVAGPQVDAIEHLRNIELDCAGQAAQMHEARLAMLRNPDGIPGAELRSMMHALQRLAAIADYDLQECDTTIEALKGTLMVPTLRLNSINLAPPYLRSDWEEALSRLPPEVSDELRQQAQSRIAAAAQSDDVFANWSIFLAERMHRARVPFAAGTDTPINLSIPGYSLHEELEMLVRAGLTPLEAIGAATLQPAAWFSLQDQMGTIEVGRRADLVLLDADPLADIRNTRSIAAVVSKGRLIER